jgi:acetyl esterase/lipase/lysophospholipase L1-like esterase
MLTLNNFFECVFPHNRSEPRIAGMSNGVIWTMTKEAYGMGHRELHGLKVMRTVLLLLVGTTSLFGKGTWEEQQAFAEKKTAEYQGNYPGVNSERFVFKTVQLPDGQSLDLDLRIERPVEGGNFPVVFFVHGGGWITGSKTHFCHQSFELAKHGIAGVRMEYRWISHGAKFPEAISDVLDAVDFIRARAGELNLDFSRVGFAGGSAGGHLSAIAAQLTQECICYDGYNGLFDALDIGSGRFGGCDYTGTTVAEKKTGSAIYMIKEAPPDTFLYHGSEDTTITPDQSFRFAEAIRAKGGSAEVLIYESVGHSFFGKEPYLSLTTQALLDHTSYVFGLSCNKPVFSDYTVAPKIAEEPDSMSIISQSQSDVPSLRDGHQDWLTRRLERIASDLATRDLGKVKTVFLGDSITQGWLGEGAVFWKATFCNELNLGVSGDRTEHVLYRLMPRASGGTMAHLDDPQLEPRCIVLMIGTNNLFKHSVAQIIAGITEVCRQLKSLEPQAEIILCSLPPTANEERNRRLVVPVNAAIRKLDGVRWLNLYSLMVDGRGMQRKELFKDDVHLNAEGYRVWHESLSLLMEELGLPREVVCN